MHEFYKSLNTNKAQNKNHKCPVNNTIFTILEVNYFENDITERFLIFKGKLAKNYIKASVSTTKNRIS